MKAQTHIVVGAATIGLVLWGAHAAGAPLDIGTVAIGLAFGTAGSIAPDIDHPRATISYRIPFGLLSLGLSLLLAPLGLRLALTVGKDLGGVVAGLLQLATPLTGIGALLVGAALVLLTLSGFASGALGHRGPVHSLAAGAGASLLVLIAVAALRLPWWYGGIFALGWTMHLVADATTHDGLPSLLWPLQADFPQAPVVSRVILIAAIALALPAWFAVSQGLDPLRGPSTVGDGRSAASTPRAVQSARQRLAEADPGVAAALVKPDAPVIGTRSGYATYTWEYLSKSATNVVTVKRIMIALDSAGRIVGVERK